MVNPQAIHIDSLGYTRRREFVPRSPSPPLKLASLNNAKTAPPLRDLDGHGRSVRSRVAPHSRSGGARHPVVPDAPRRLGSATRCRSSLGRCTTPHLSVKNAPKGYNA
ncbi:hypothetical protein MUK42_03570 [Musa troglodytarum]|uniref:Uncharacterized protein n=1 Tax=Musa troglodytarum TaxID=320322 RepID=A0A9E7HBJ2_9LILI|nr:hypothetical protein MUK42_03570 [Musa troglodytarum]